MQHYAAFHLGLHCLPKYTLWCFPYTKGLLRLAVLYSPQACYGLIDFHLYSIGSVHFFYLFIPVLNLGVAIDELSIVFTVNVTVGEY